MQAISGVGVDSLAALRSILAPLEPAAFFSNICERRPALVRRPGARGHFSGVFESREVWAMLEQGQLRYGEGVDVTRFTAARQRETLNYNSPQPARCCAACTQRSTPVMTWKYRSRHWFGHTLTLSLQSRQGSMDVPTMFNPLALQCRRRTRPRPQARAKATLRSSTLCGAALATVAACVCCTRSGTAPPSRLRSRFLSRRYSAHAAATRI